MFDRTKILIKASLSVGLLSSCLLFPPFVSAGAKISIDDTRWVSIGAGMRSIFTATEDGAGSDGDDYSHDFAIDSVRLYFDGQIHQYIKMTVNTECATAGPRGCSQDPDMELLDAIARFEINPQFNIWAGRMLVPADRIEMNGPYYGLSWNQYTVPLLPSDNGGPAGEWGRDEGVTLWGTHSKFQYAFGVFDGLSGNADKEHSDDKGANVDDNLLYGGRFAYNFLNQENNPAYYTSSTYYGTAGDIFTLGFSFNHQDDGVGSEANPGDFSAYIVDLLFEKPLDNGGVVTIEGEYKVFDAGISAAKAATVATRAAATAARTAATAARTIADDTPSTVNTLAAIVAADTADAAEATADNTNDNCFCLFDGDSYFVTVGYLFPQVVGIGKFQPYVRWNENMPDAGESSNLLELGMNYVISGHNARLNANWRTGDAQASGSPTDNDVNTFQLALQLQY